MATPAAVLSILVKTQGVQTAGAQLTTLDKSGRNAAAGLAKAEGSAKRSSRSFSMLSATAKGAAGAAGIGGLAIGIRFAMGEFREAQKVGAQTNAVLKSTGGVAKVTAKDVGDLATAISKKAGIDDEAVQKGENLLLTFKNIRNETGRGRDIFNQATQAAVDLSAAGFGSLDSTSKQLGKALNDPVKGMTALGRSGVTFSEDQKKAIGALMETGKASDRVKAQQIVLKEVQSQVGGSAQAQATNADKLRVSLGNLGEKAGGAVAPLVDKAAGALSKFTDGMVEGKGAGGTFVDALGKVGDAAGTAGGAVGSFVAKVKDGNPAAVALAGVIGTLTTAYIALKVQALASAAATAIVNAAETRGTAIFVLKRAAVLAARGALVTYTAAQWLLNAALTANPIGLVVAALALLAAGVVLAYKKSETFRNIVNSVATTLRNVLIGAIDKVLGGFSSFLGAIARVARALGQDGLANKAQAGQRAIDDLRESLRAIPNSKDVDVKVKIKLDGQDIDVTNAEPLSPTPPGGDGPGVIGSRINDLVRANGGVKDGIKKLVADGLGSFVPGVGGAVGSLMGASASLRPFAAVGAQFGLHVTSGLRPGAITSSGNTSYHASGRAIDLGNGKGPDAAKMSAFKALKARYGPMLAELIYTPGGVGIKNGQPFRYTGQVAADHYDHVHVAFAGARAAGQAAGNGRNQAAQGDGIGDVARLARSAGFKGNALTTAIAVAGAESGFRSKASNRNSNGTIDRGYWQINSIHGARSTFDPVGNARAAFAISSGGRNWRPWVTYNTGAYQRFLDQARTAAGSVSGSATKGTAGGATSTAGSGAASTAAKVNPLDQKIANADLAIQQVAGNPAAQVRIGSRSVSRGFQQIQAMTAKRKLIGARIRSIRKALKGKLSGTKRLALTQELTQRLSEHAQLGTDIAALKTPAAVGGDGGSIGDVGGEVGDPDQALIDAQNAAAEASRLAAEAAQKLADAIKEHSDLVAQNNAEIKRQTDFANAVTNTSNFQMTKSLADLLSGQIVGYGVAGRAFTPGSGVEYRY